MGSARSWRSTEFQGWTIAFYDELQHFEAWGTAEDASRVVRLRLRDHRLGQSLVGRRLAEQLAAGDGRRSHSFKLAVIGRVETSAEGGYEVLLDSLFNLSMRLVTTMSLSAENRISVDSQARI